MGQGRNAYAPLRLLPVGLLPAPIKKDIDMHYYKFNISDYRKDTVHLTPIEHYIYRSLIDWYYLDELPIPKETQSVMRRLCLGIESVSLLQNVLNDLFSPSIGFIDIVAYRFTIFDRWGEVMFQTSDSAQGWNGRYNEHKCEPGVYVWVMSFKSASGQYIDRKGVVTLLR